MASNITPVTRQGPTQQPVPSSVTTAKPKISAFDRFLIRLGLKTVKPAKDPLRNLVGSWNKLPKPRIDGKSTGLKTLMVIRHSGSGVGKGQKLSTSERAELLSTLSLKMKPCRADQVGAELKHLIWTTLADRGSQGNLVARNLMDLIDSGSIGEAHGLIMDKLLADNPWMQQSGITAEALSGLARTGLDAVMDGLLPRAMEDAEKTRLTVSKSINHKVGSLDDAIKSRLLTRSGLKDGIDGLKDMRADVKNTEKLLDYDQDVLAKRLGEEIGTKETRLKDAEEAWTELSEPIFQKIGLLRDGVKSPYTPKSDIKDAIEQLKDMKADVMKESKLLPYDQDVLTKRLDEEIAHMEMLLKRKITLPGPLSKLDPEKLSDDALRALARLERKGFLKPRFLQRFADSWCASDIANANKTWKHIAWGDGGLINEIIGDGHWEEYAARMKLSLSETDPKSERGEAVLIEHRFMIGKRNLTKALETGGFFANKGKKSKMPSSFRDIRVDDKLLSALMKVNAKVVPERNVILGNLVLLQLKVDGKDLGDPKVLAEARKILAKAGLKAADVKDIETWARQGFRSTKEIAGVIEALNKFVGKLTKSEHALKVLDEVIDSSPKAFAQRGVVDMSVAITRLRSRAIVEKNPKLVDKKITEAIQDIKRELALGGGLSRLTDLLDRRTRLGAEITNNEKRITTLENRIQSGKDHLIKLDPLLKGRTLSDIENDRKLTKSEKKKLIDRLEELQTRPPGLRSSTRGLLVIQIQDKIDEIEKTLGKGKSSPVLTKLKSQRKKLLRALRGYDPVAGHSKAFSKNKLGSRKTVAEQVSLLRANKERMQAIIDIRQGGNSLKALKKNLTRMKKQLPKIEQAYTKALGKVESRRIRNFVRLAVLRTFVASGKTFKDFKPADFKTQLMKQLSAWGMTGDALKLEVDRLMKTELSHDVIKAWTADVRKTEDPKNTLAKEIDKFLDGNKDLKTAILTDRVRDRVKELVNGLGRNEGVSLSFGTSGSIQPADIPVGAGDVSLSLRMELTKSDSINIRNTGNGVEVLIKGGGSGNLSASLTGLMGMFDAGGKVSAGHLKGAQFNFKTNADAIKFVSELTTGTITPNTLKTVGTVRGVTDTFAEVSMKARFGYSNESQKDVHLSAVNKTATFGLAVEVQAKAGASARFSKSVIQNNQTHIQSYSRTYQVNARVDVKLTGKVQLGDKEKERELEGNKQFRRRVTHGVEVHRSFDTIRPETCVKLGMRAYNQPLVTLSALLPDSIRSKLDPAKLQTLLDALDGNPDKMITLESRITDDALHKINELRSKGAKLIGTNKKTEGQKLMQEADKLLSDPKSYAPSRLVVDADVFKLKSEKVKSLLGGKVEIKQFAVGRRTFGGVEIDVKNLLQK